MDLTIELSFDIGKNNVTQTKSLLLNLSENCNAIISYFLHEIEGHRNIIDRNDCINIVEFGQKEDLINYLRTIEKYRFIKIDCIYNESKEVNLIYA